MDQKTWLWKKRSEEKTLVVDKANNSLSTYEEEKTEVEEYLTDKTELEREIGILNTKLYSALSECNAKDKIAKKQVKIAEEAIAGWEKAETEAIYYKQELDKVLRQKAASEETLSHFDAAFKEYKTRAEANFNALKLRLESTEKANASLKYDVRVLEKELDIRNEEREFNRRTSCVAQKQLGNLEMNLMDDFAEMEKLAVVSVDKSHGNIVNISNTKNFVGKVDSDVKISIQKIVELLEGINIPSGYTVRVFQWKSDELSDILRNFVRMCNDLMNGSGNLEKFTLEVGLNLEWIMNHCFSLQDVSSMKDEIRNHLDWDEWRSESSHNGSCDIEALEPTVDKKGKIENVQLENNGECVTTQLQESKDIFENLHLEMETKEKESKGRIGNHIKKHKLINEDLETHLENEVENRNDSCKRVDVTCNEVKIQLERTSEEVSDDGRHREKHLQNDWEITAASQKLAECQETIINLGKQLKALASPNDAALFDKVTSTPRRSLSRRSSLLDKMLAEDDDKNRAQSGNSNSGVRTVAGQESAGKFTNGNETAVAISRDIVPCKKNGGRSFFKRLFLRRKKGKTSL